MEIKVTRKPKKGFTPGQLYINDKFECMTLEDEDRGLTQDMPLSEITAKKVFAKTAIPTGRYEVTMTFSNHFKKYMPLVMKVPGFEGIRIHSGNKPEDTEGCLLTGNEDPSDGFMGESKAATQKIYSLIENALKTEKVFITYGY